MLDIVINKDFTLEVLDDCISGTIIQLDRYNFRTEINVEYDTDE